jgi:hypothetical protein
MLFLNFTAFVVFLGLRLRSSFFDAFADIGSAGARAFLSSKLLCAEQDPAAAQLRGEVDGVHQLAVAVAAAPARPPPPLQVLELFETGLARALADPAATRLLLKAQTHRDGYERQKRLRSHDEDCSFQERGSTSKARITKAECQGRAAEANAIAADTRASLQKERLEAMAEKARLEAAAARLGKEATEVRAQIEKEAA